MSREKKDNILAITILYNVSMSGKTRCSYSVPLSEAISTAMSLKKLAQNGAAVIEQESPEDENYSLHVIFPPNHVIGEIMCEPHHNVPSDAPGVERAHQTSLT